MLRVFGDIHSGNCFKVKLLLEQLGAEYEWVTRHRDKSKSHRAVGQQ